LYPVVMTVHSQIRGMFMAALGCNVAWGLVGLGLESSSRTTVGGPT
jgi:hypothetical protein